MPKFAVSYKDAKGYTRRNLVEAKDEQDAREQSFAPSDAIVEPVISHELPVAPSSK